MSSVWLVPREEWEEALKSYGCKPLEGKGPLNSAEWWQMPWGVYPFTVSIEDDGRCDRRALNRLIADIVSQAPPGWEFPE